MTVETILQEVTFFSQLPVEVLDELVKSGQTLSFASGEVVCREGELTDAMYVILEGDVRVYKQDDDGQEVDIDALQPGDFFGEMALLDNRPRSATVACATPCRLFMLARAAFMNLLLDPQTQTMALSVLAALTQRVRLLMERFFDEELARRTMAAEMEADRHRSLAYMVAGVAHELNTPLGIVNTAVDMIDKRVKSDALTVPLQNDKAAQTAIKVVQEASQLALRNIDRAHKLVLNFKKISVHQLTETREHVDLSQLVLDILELFKINARHAKLQIEVNDNLRHDQKMWSGYPGNLTQVLTNLLFNIERYAYPNQDGGKIEIGLRAENSHQPPCFVLTVQDFGQGIEPDHLAQVFTPFFTTGRSQGGSGLGLAIVHNIVTDALQGTIKVKSELNIGTTFTVTFPQIIP